MDCPICHTSLKSESVHGQTVERCVACNGMWLDLSELGSVVRHTPLPTTPAKLVECSDGIVCPKCHEPLAPFNYAHDSGVLINKCPVCGGIWIESGQLDLLAQYRSGKPAIQRLGDALADDIRASNRLRFTCGLLRSRLLSGIVAIGYLFFVVLAAGSLRSVLSLLLFLSLPMMCIWFPDTMGNLKGISLGLGRPTITHTTPGDLVAIGGWLLLLCPVVVALIILT